MGKKEVKGFGYQEHRGYNKMKINLWEALSMKKLVSLFLILFILCFSLNISAQDISAAVDFSVSVELVRAGSVVMEQTMQFPRVDFSGKTQKIRVSPDDEFGKENCARLQISGCNNSFVVATVKHEKVSLGSESGAVASDFCIADEKSASSKRFSRKVSCDQFSLYLGASLDVPAYSSGSGNARNTVLISML